MGLDKGRTQDNVVAVVGRDYKTTEPELRPQVVVAMGGGMRKAVEREHKTMHHEIGLQVLD